MCCGDGREDEDASRVVGGRALGEPQASMWARGSAMVVRLVLVDSELRLRKFSSTLYLAGVPGRF